MSKRTQIILIILCAPAFLLVFVVIHEAGHTALARLLGDPASTFYLYQITPKSACLGCNVYDDKKLTQVGNLLVSIGGLLFTQAAAIFTLFVAGRLPPGSFRRRLLIVYGLVFAFLDVPLQVIQGLAANVAGQSALTGVDLADCLYLASRLTGISPADLKIALLILAFVYLGLVYRWRPRLGQPPPGPAPSDLPHPQIGL